MTMALCHSKRRILLSLTFSLIFVFSFFQLRYAADQVVFVPPLTTNHEVVIDKKWSWDPQRDRDNHSLSSEQCSSAFPLLYQEINRAQNYWKSRSEDGNGNITSKTIDLAWSVDGGLRCMIYEQNLYIIEPRGLNHFGHWSERHRAILGSIRRAILTAREPIPNIEFSIKINDDVHLTENNQDTALWAFSRNIFDPIQRQLWVIPDFNFWAYPRVAGSFNSFQRQALQTGDSYRAKISKLVWRGTTQFNPMIRNALLQQSSGKPWSDVVALDEEASTKSRLSAEDQCRYKFAAHTEGTSWSGRLKYLLSCNSVIFIHPLKHYTHLYHLLEPTGSQQNYVPVKLDWSDLGSKVQEMIVDEDKAATIARNAKSVFRDRYLTPAAQTCYFRRLFHAWRDVPFEPETYELVPWKTGQPVKRIRGISYEEYM
jgi:hypothetical protein